MGLREELTRDLVAAQKGGDALRRNTIRQILNGIKNREIETRAELADDDIQAVIARLVSQHNDSIAHFEHGGRADLVEQETAERRILEHYLPPPLSDDELNSLIDDAIAEAGAQEPRQMGAVMKALMPKITGRADGKVVSERVKARLAGNAGAT